MNRTTFLNTALAETIAALNAQAPDGYAFILDIDGPLAKVSIKRPNNSELLDLYAGHNQGRTNGGYFRDKRYLLTLLAGSLALVRDLHHTKAPGRKRKQVTPQHAPPVLSGPPAPPSAEQAPHPTNDIIVTP